MQKASRYAIIEAEGEGFLGATVELARAHLEIYPDDAATWFFFGRALGRLSRFAESEAALEKAIVESEGRMRSSVYTERGHINQRRGDYLEAENWFFQAIVLEPELSYNHVFRAVSSRRRGDLKLAEQRYREALVVCRAEELDEIYANLGGVLVAQERYAEAVEYFERALEIEPDYEFAQIRLKDARKAAKLRQSQ